MVSWETVHVAINDQSRVAHLYYWTMSAPGGATETVDWYRQQGVPVTAIPCYTSEAYAAACAELGVIHRRT